MMSLHQKRRLSDLHRIYAQDLEERARRVKCPVCGAKPKKKCLSKRWRLHFGYGALYEVNWTHYRRKREAKRVGIVKGWRKCFEVT